jgi:UDP-GlcNAc3NAcA epimerase
MIKILTIIGARPQIIKAAAISRAISQHFQDDFFEVLVHTGQHYDENMSEVFIHQLNIPQPAYNLAVGSGSHGVQTGEMLRGIEEILFIEKPNYLLVYGDTNSTLAGALAAVKMDIPVIHVEAGLRSFNKTMPEEINRILTDHASTYLFPPTTGGIQNLKNEGFELEKRNKYDKDHPGIFHVGDVMYDNSLYYAQLAEKEINLRQSFGIEKNQFVLCTIHRNQNTDNKEKLSDIFRALIEISKNLKVFLPIHPRTKKLMELNLPKGLLTEIRHATDIIINPPVGFLEMISLEKNASLVMTDSGGVQKEAFFFEKPCIIFREETEWTEIIENGMAILTGSDTGRIIEAFNFYQNVSTTQKSKEGMQSIYGKGDAAYEILKIVKEHHGI